MTPGAIHSCPRGAGGAAAHKPLDKQSKSVNKRAGEGLSRQCCRRCRRKDASSCLRRCDGHRLQCCRRRPKDDDSSSLRSCDGGSQRISNSISSKSCDDMPSVSEKSEAASSAQDREGAALGPAVISGPSSFVDDSGGISTDKHLLFLSRGGAWAGPGTPQTAPQDCPGNPPDREDQDPCVPGGPPGTGLQTPIAGTPMGLPRDLPGTHLRVHGVLREPAWAPGTCSGSPRVHFRLAGVSLLTPGAVHSFPWAAGGAASEKKPLAKDPKFVNKRAGEGHRQQCCRRRRRKDDSSSLRRRMEAWWSQP